MWLENSACTVFIEIIPTVDQKEGVEVRVKTMPAEGELNIDPFTTKDNRALIIINSEYKDANGEYKKLGKPGYDGEMMERMLQGYKTKVVSNKEDIGAEVDQFMKEQSTATKEINRLHFHFSGHCVYNAKVLLKD